MNDEQVLKRKRHRFIVESDSDDDNQMMDLKDEEIKIGPIGNFVKHEALEKVLATREHLSKRIKKIDEIIANEKRNSKKETQVQ
jgi:phosphoglycerol transferase MdoB-like AlkP superfamily enzyme